jgi:radical SAM-linked protein
MDLDRILEERILPRVDKPSRYLGNEVNAVRKDPATVDVRMALAFPDLYDLGLGNLGIHILYAVVNQLPWASCERLYAPARDMEAQLRAHGVPLFTLETRSPVREMDLVGFTLQSELTYTNILAMLELAGVSLRTADRREDDPLTCAGGPSVFNPEPLAPFLDFFVIGDGEDAIVEIASVLRGMRGRPRAERLAALAQLEGIYVPALYPMETLPDGSIRPPVDGPRIRKRITRDLDGATFPVDYIVPYTQQVHDRVSLVSLSTCDYSRVRQLVENTVETARAERVSVSLPSLRLDSFSVELADMVAETRRTGLTVAPEAASPRLRAVINKWIPDDELLDMTCAAYERGWDHVKMYFMIGLPTERDDDIVAIADLAARAVTRGREKHGKAKAHLGVSTFVPKPFTPFQWAAQIGFEETERRQDVLQRALNRDSRIKFGRHDPEETFLEGLVSRADRRAGDLVEAAYRHGARFDAWREHLDMDAWRRAIEETGYDVAGALRERDPAERLPWDHIDVLIPKDWFVADWERAKVLEHAEDCRHSKCHKCGVIDHERPLCASMLRKSVKGRAPEAEWTRKPTAPWIEPPAVQRLWVRTSRTSSARFLSHLEAMNTWLRALRRARIQLAYSQGFHPHPKVAFSSALPHNQQSTGEYMDLTLTERCSPEDLVARLARVLHEGFGFHGAAEVALGSASVMILKHGEDVVVALPGEDPEAVEERVRALLASETLVVDRVKKGQHGSARPATRKVEVRSSIVTLSVRPGVSPPTVDARLAGPDGGQACKSRDLVGWLTDDADRAVVIRKDTLTRTAAGLVSLSDVWGTTGGPPRG